VVFGYEAGYDDPTPERLPGQPNRFARYTQIIECSGPHFGVGSGKGATELDLVVIGAEALYNSPASAERMYDHTIAAAKPN
jgi:hypothetical protein